MDTLEKDARLPITVEKKCFLSLLFLNEDICLQKLFFLNGNQLCHIFNTTFQGEKGF